MNIITKLNLGDDLFVVEKTSFTEIVLCAACNGTGKLELTPVLGKIPELYDCPACFGKGGEEKYLKHVWDVIRHGTVKAIEARRYAPDRDAYFVPVSKDATYYMSSNSGSGTLYSEENCFDSMEKAILEAEKRNL